MNCVVFGGCGYVGSRLIPFLLADGHNVTCIDTQWFGEGSMSDNENLTVLKEDIRFCAWPMKDIDAVIHLASLSNNEMYKKDEKLTRLVNTMLPASGHGVTRYIYASSVAAYGTSDDVLTEDSPLKPTTPYGEDKAYCEEAVLKNGGTAVRAASVCGHSENMRFDTPINRMTRDAITTRKITVNGGEQKRCHIALDDLCDFYKLLLKSPAQKIAGQAFNVVDRTMAMLETAITVSSNLSGLNDCGKIDIEQLEAKDARSYRVSGAKAARVLGFKLRVGIETSIRMMHGHARAPQYRDFSPARMRML